MELMLILIVRTSTFRIFETRFKSGDAGGCRDDKQYHMLQGDACGFKLFHHAISPTNRLQPELRRLFTAKTFS